VRRGITWHIHDPNSVDSNTYWFVPVARAWIERVCNCDCQRVVTSCVVCQYIYVFCTRVVTLLVYRVNVQMVFIETMCCKTLRVMYVCVWFVWCAVLGAHMILSMLMWNTTTDQQWNTQWNTTTDRRVDLLCKHVCVWNVCVGVCVCLCVCLYWLSCVCNHKPTFHVIWSQFDIDWHDTSVRYKPTPFPICSALLYSALFLLCSALPISNRHGTRGPYIHICICNILGWFAMHGWIGTPNKNHPQSYQNVLQHTFGVYYSGPEMKNHSKKKKRVFHKNTHVIWDPVIWSPWFL